MQVKQSPGQIFISQEKHTEDLLKKFNVLDCKPLSTLMTTNEKLPKYGGKEKVGGATYQILNWMINLSH